jgi:hypothetical protein
MGSEPRNAAKPYGEGLWRVWDRKRIAFFPDDLLLELNAQKSPNV